MEPSLPTAASTHTEKEGLTSPRSIFFAEPSSGWIQTAVCTPSRAQRKSDLPSGIQMARWTLRSSARVKSVPSPPVEEVTKISFSLLLKSPSRGNKYAIFEPSGENRPKLSNE